MIGGTDRHFPMVRRRLPEALDSAAHAILRRWRRAVFQSAEGAVFETLGDVPLSGASELFVYRDAASLLDWETQGATPENATTMIHLLASDDGLTVVVGDPDESVASAVLKELDWLDWIRFEHELPRRAA